MLGWAVAGVGLLGLLDALLPQHRTALFAAFAPEAAHGLSKGLVAPLSIALFVAARGLVRRQHRAWQVAIGLLAALTLLHAARRFDQGALVAGLATVALLARRNDFRFRGDPAAKPRMLVHALVALLVVAGYGFATLWANRLMADHAFTFGFALRETARAAVGLSLRRADHLAGSFAEWFPVSEFALFLGAAGLLLVEWLGPWRHRVIAEARERERVHAIVARWGSDTLAPFALRADKYEYFFGEEERSFLAYRVVGGVAIVAGDPVGPGDDLPALLVAFIEFAHGRGWRLAVLGASSSFLDLYRANGLHSLYHGDEAMHGAHAVLHPAGRSPASAKGAAVVPPARAERLPDVRPPAERDRPGGARRAGGDRAHLARRRARTGLRDGARRALSPRRRRGALRRRPGRRGTAAGLPPLRGLRGRLRALALLDAAPADDAERVQRVADLSALGWARAEGIARVSLNFAPFASLLAPEAVLTLRRGRAGARSSR